MNLFPTIVRYLLTESPAHLHNKSGFAKFFISAIKHGLIKKLSYEYNYISTFFNVNLFCNTTLSSNIPLCTFQVLTSPHTPERYRTSDNKTHPPPKELGGQEPEF